MAENDKTFAADVGGQHRLTIVAAVVLIAVLAVSVALSVSWSLVGLFGYGSSVLIGVAVIALVFAGLAVRKFARSAALVERTMLTRGNQ